MFGARKMMMGGRDRLKLRFVYATFGFGSITTATISSIVIDPVGDKQFIIGILYGANPNVTVSTVTIAGISATRVDATRSYNPGLGSIHSGTQFWIVDIPAGVTGDAVIAFTAAIQRYGVYFWEIKRRKKVVVYDAAVGQGSTNIDLSADTKAGQSAVFAIAYVAGGFDVALSGVDSHPKNTVDTSRKVIGGSIVPKATENPRPVSATFTGNSFTCASALVLA